jgi:SAM-dependent methyltransferase
LRYGRYSNKAEIYAVYKYLDFNLSDKLIDIGCGSGRIALHFAKHVKDIVGIDISPRAIFNFNNNMNENNLNGKGIVADICEFRNDIGEFDSAYSCATIQHIPSINERVKALININKLLKENGVLVLTVHNWEGDEKNLRYKEGFYGSGGSKDLWRAAFTENDLRKLLELTGFKVLRSGGIFCIPFVIMKRLPEFLYFLESFFSRFKLSIKIGKYLIVKAIKIREAYPASRALGKPYLQSGN